MFRILYASQDKGVFNQLRSFKLTQSWKLCAANSLENAVDIFKEVPIDVALFDHSLLKNRLDVLERLTTTHFSTRYVIIGAQAVDDRLMYWKVNADAVLHRDVQVAELLFVLERLCFRQKVADQAVLQLCDALQLYPNDGMLYVNTRSHQLRKKEAQLLSCLLIHKNMVVSKQLLFDWIWGKHDAYPCQTTLEVYIARLRKSLGVYADALETIRGLGYRFNSEVVERVARQLYPISEDKVLQTADNTQTPVVVYQV
jgi:DNA-binding response OmpR family regulator